MSVESNRPRLLRSLIRPASGLSVSWQCCLVIALEVPVRVPTRLEVTAAGKNLHIANAALHQPARHQRLTSEVISALFIQAVQLAGRVAIPPLMSMASVAWVCIVKPARRSRCAPTSSLSSGILFQVLFVQLVKKRQPPCCCSGVTIRRRLAGRQSASPVSRNCVP